jgi:uncharacterized protein
MKKVARILCIDGGGIKGLIPATIIAEWEKVLGPIAQHFHMLAGTSTGGILAAGLAGGTPAEKLMGLYRDNGPAIFESSSLSLGGLTGQLYEAEPLERAMQKVLTGDLADLPGELLIPAYDIEAKSPFLFKSWKAAGIELSTGDKQSGYNFPLMQACRATSAAPTFFPPAKVRAEDGKEYALIDGGVFANNPAMLAYVAARRLYPKADEFLIVSLGTGQLTKPVKYDDAMEFGLVGWARPLLDIMFEGVSATTEYQLSQMAGVSQYRFQTSLEGGSEAMDDASQENLASLIKLAAKTCDKFGSDMKGLAERLREPLTNRAALGFPTRTAPPKPVKAVTIVPPKKVITPVTAIGATGGAVAGGAVGGPLGALIGAVGGWLAGFNSEK